MLRLPACARAAASHALNRSSLRATPTIRAALRVGERPPWMARRTGSAFSHRGLHVQTELTSRHLGLRSPSPLPRQRASRTPSPGGARRSRSNPGAAPTRVSRRPCETDRSYLGEPSVASGWGEDDDSFLGAAGATTDATPTTRSTSNSSYSSRRRAVARRNELEEAQQLPKQRRVPFLPMQLSVLLLCFIALTRARPSDSHSWRNVLRLRQGVRAGGLRWKSLPRWSG
jgi:hypothetical protein